MTVQRVSNVAFDRWDALVAAINQLVSNGVYRQLVQIHAEMQEDPDGWRRSLHHMHGSMSGPLGYKRFLPWHRAYLIVFERELRGIDPSLSIPYWDWDTDLGRLIGFRDLNDLSDDLSFERNLGTTPSEGVRENRQEWFVGEGEVELLQSYSGSYYSFTWQLERGLHNRGHGWIGGTMNTMASPTDPAFWFHHAQIDRIWAMWQQGNPGRKAHLSGRKARLDPWQDEFDVKSVDAIRQLGNDSYEYVPPPEA